MKLKNINKQHKRDCISVTLICIILVMEKYLAGGVQPSGDGVWLPHIPGCAAWLLAAGRWEEATAQYASVNESKGSLGRN